MVSSRAWAATSTTAASTAASAAGRACSRFEPPHRFVISWDINARSELETDHEKTSEVEVRFLAEAPDRTRVELDHRNLERHGDGWEQMRASIGSPKGWSCGLRRFAEAAGMA